ncbi:unnamed protein product [Mytilus edulis]|uniref:Peptidase A2 domain-containing protein n=1 Tax=Mytilus edulis TaxID=6550 RepID=A0A8S3REX6_MYTED|nr:unnamed protein product [Mytilus edulis]
MKFDTGAVASVISKFSFDKLKLSTALLEEVQTTLTAVDGEEIKVYGQIKLKFTISNKKVFVHTFVVAEVYETSGIFGMDFLEKFDAILFVSKSHMIIAGHKIRLYKLGFTTCAHIKLAEKVVIPPESELTIKGNVFGQKLNTPSVLEPRKDFYKDGLLMTRTLCHESDRHIFVNAINLTSQAIHLPKETLIGKLDTVVSIQPIKKENKIEENIEQVCLPEHLKCLIDNASPELTSEQRQQLEKCIFEYQDIFSSPDGKLGRTGIVKHSIDTGDAKPVRVPPRRIPLGQKQVIETEIDKMLKNDVIEPSNSAWSSPVLLVTKKDNSVRFCVDFRALNSLKIGYKNPESQDTLWRGIIWFPEKLLHKINWNRQYHKFNGNTDLGSHENPLFWSCGDFIKSYLQLDPDFIHVSSEALDVSTEADDLSDFLEVSSVSGQPLFSTSYNSSTAIDVYRRKPRESIKILDDLTFLWYKVDIFQYIEVKLPSCQQKLEHVNCLCDEKKSKMQKK